MNNEKIGLIKKKVLKDGILTKSDFRYLKKNGCNIARYERNMGDDKVFEWKINDALILRFIVEG